MVGRGRFVGWCGSGMAVCVCCANSLTGRARMMETKVMKLDKFHNFSSESYIIALVWYNESIPFAALLLILK